MVKTRLSVMMFMQYAVWGVWLPVLARYLSAPIDAGGLAFTDVQIGLILGLAGSIGGITAPFIAGQMADRYFSGERFLATLLFLGGIVNWILAYQTSFGAWLVFSIIYSLVYTPTLALSNSVAFANLTDGSREFPKVRIWGTFGWIAASWLFPMIWLQSGLQFQVLPPFFAGTEVADATARLVDTLKVSGTLSILYALFCLSLPHTPPKRDAVEPLAFKKAFALLRHRSFAVLVAASLVISLIHQIYFMQTSKFLPTIGISDSSIGPVMSIGQFAEIAVMALLGLMIKRLGFRWVMFMGCLAYFLRYMVFGTTDLPYQIIVASQVLHGFCYACFFAAGFIYVDKLADADVRHSAQTVFGIIILGVGPVLSGYLNGVLSGICTPEGGELNYSMFWYICGAVGLVTAISIALLFKDETKDKQPATT
jgi:nucleoside transporter